MSVSTKKKIVMIISLIFAITLVGCGTGEEIDVDYDTVEHDRALKEDDRGEERSVEETDGNNELNGEVSPERMFIFNGALELEVDDVAEARRGIEDYLTQYNGYVSDASFSIDYGVLQGKMTVRVPQEHFMETMDYLENKGEVIDRSITSEDVTSDYVDIESELRSLRKQQDRYLEMIAEAGEISEMLKVEEKLQEVRSQIESIVGRKRSLEDEVNYATITVDLQKDRDIYTVEFYSNTGDFDKRADKVDIEVKEGHTLGDRDFPEVNKSGYDFIEWNTKKDGEGRQLDDRLEIKENMKVYAIWEEVDDKRAVNLGLLQDLGGDVRNAFVFGLNGLIFILTNLTLVVTTILPFALVIAAVIYGVLRVKKYWKKEVE